MLGPVIICDSLHVSKSSYTSSWKNNSNDNQGFIQAPFGGVPPNFGNSPTSRIFSQVNSSVKTPVTAVIKGAAVMQALA